MNTATEHARALLAHAPDTATPLRARRQMGTALPSVPVEGLELCREETAAALFEGCADLCGLPQITADALYDLLKQQVREMGPAGLLEHTEDFSHLDSTEFFEVGECRWYAYRLALTFWYRDARTRPMTAGEAAAALYLSDWARTAARGRPGPRQVARHIREGAASLPVAALVRLGRGTVADLARVPDPAGSGRWLYRQLMPDRARARACFDLIRGPLPVPLPMVVRTDTGAYAVGATPPPGPGNRWARPLRAQW
ncbi:hypothetical protein ABTY63_26135 [Streptomyces solisilvae]|uniref:hypothetical protein n=1 Tax=Streptomyces malaysiensis TaxID=92644 RepID=UPI00331974AC